MHKPILSAVEVAGSVEEFGYGWLHIMLHTLLPHCRYQTPGWLSDTIRRLLDGYEACGKRLPFYSRALLVIDEHTGIEGRHIFDQDNKGWKAVSNAIKGRLIPDDDQHTLACSLLGFICPPSVSATSEPVALKAVPTSSCMWIRSCLASFIAVSLPSSA